MSVGDLAHSYLRSSKDNKVKSKGNIKPQLWTQHVEWPYGNFITSLYLSHRVVLKDNDVALHLLEGPE